MAARQGGILVNIFRDRLAFLESVRIGEWVLSEKKKECATEHDALLLNELGYTISALCDKKKAISYYERALAIDERVFGKEHPDVAIDLNNLGAAYFALGDKKRARPYSEQAYNIFNKFFWLYWEGRGVIE